MDVNTAFLNDILEMDMFMEIPKGYDCSDEIRSRKVWKLKKNVIRVKSQS